MRKLKILAVFLLSICTFAGFKINSNKVLASESSVSITESIVIAEDTKYENTTFNINIAKNGDEELNVFVIESGATLTLKGDCKISGVGSDYTVDNIFKVNAGAKLVLDGVDITNIVCTMGAISNYGQIKITDTNFVSGYYSILNESDDASSFLLESGSLYAVKLNKGYISVNENTRLDGKVNLAVASSYYDNVGTVVVKGVGENVFASKHIGNFTHTDKSGEDVPFELDYLGDLGQTQVYDAVYTDRALQSGDIVLTQRTLGIKDSGSKTKIEGVEFAPYCTLDKYLSDDSATTLYKNSAGVALDNYTMRYYTGTSMPLFSAKMEDAGTITLTVNVIDGDGNTFDTVTESYLAGSNRAIFVDIPHDQTLGDIKYYKDQTENTGILQMEDDLTKMFSNGIYMRPIVKYIDESNSYDSVSMTINIYFEKAVEYAEVNVTTKNNVQLEYEDNMIVGELYTFRINKPENVSIKGVKIDDESISLTEDANGYFFQLVATSEINVVIDSVIVLNVVPNLSKTEFVYGEAVVLEETYTVEESQEQITIIYDATDKDTIVGEYVITSAVCIDNNNYEIILADGRHTYSIIQKEVFISEISTKIYEIEYDPNISLQASNFVDSIPSYFTASLNLEGFNPSSSLEHNLDLEISLNDTHNYVLLDAETTLSVTLKFKVVELNLSSCVLDNLTKEYTGQAIEIELDIPDAIKDKVIVNYKYYDVDAGEFVTSAVNSGEYTVTATIEDSIFYDYTDDTFTATLTITKKHISLSNEVVCSEAEVEFAEIITLTEDMFIVSIPDYLDAKLEYNTIDPTDGKIQYVNIIITTNNDNYTIDDDENYISATIYIIPKQINTSVYNWDQVEYTYNENGFAPKLVGIDQTIIQVNYVYSIKSTQETTSKIINAGTYVAKAVLTAPDCYILSQTEFSTDIVVNKASICLEEYEELIDVVEIEYDKSEHGLDNMSDELLIIGGGHVSISGVDKTNKYTDVGDYYYTIYLEYDDNHTGVDSIVSLLKITPKLITITLEQTQFDYTGSAPILKAVVSGGLTGDTISAQLSQSTQINAGTYFVTVTGIDNNNYTFDDATELEYEIRRIAVDLSNIEFNEIEVDYDGQTHLPSFVGVLPTGITCTVENVVCKNVGVYNVKCLFSSTNDNYITPDPISTKVIINKRRITVIFENPDNLLANGVEKSIGVRFENVVDGETVKHTKRYSRTPINAGTYTCYVELPEDSNYTIVNSKKYDFAILSSDTTYHDEKISLIIEGRFAGDGDVKVVHTNDDVQIANALLKDNVKNYKSINLSYTSYSTDPVVVSVALDDVVEDARYLKLYKFERGELVELEYKIDNNLVSFSLSSGGDIIFVEEHSGAYMNRWIIIAVVAASILCVAGGITFAIIHHKKSCKNKKKNSVK